MLKAVLFDFNGVIADDEPLHLEMFQKVLAEEAVPLSHEDYYDKNYLGMNDHDCFQTVLKAHGRTPSEDDLKQLIARKTAYYQQCIRDRLILFPGALELVKQVAGRYPLAIVSGALRNEIEIILEHAGLKPCFAVIVSAEDVREGKPSPEGFLLALQQINDRRSHADPPALPGESLVIEDSPFGIAAARSAGMQCLAVTHSYPAERLGQADLVVSTLEGLGLNTLESLFQPPSLKQPVLAYCPDLLFTTKISETGRHLGIPVQVSSSPDQLEEQAAALQPALIIIDLGGNGVDYPRLIGKLRHALPDANLIAYGSHVEKKLREEAQSAGCRKVFVRSEFVKALPDLLKGHLPLP